MNIADHTFLISGGASGLGAATATHFVERGARVVLADLNAGAGEALAETLGEAARFVQTDVTDGDSVRAAVDVAMGLGDLRGAICCAGVAIGERTLSRRGPHALESFARVLNVNLLGTFNVVRLAAAALAAGEPEPTEAGDAERGVIVCTASIAAFDGQIGQAAYAASKGGIVGMTLPLARDLAALGIRVATIAPGIFETPLLGTLPPAVREQLSQQVPFPPRLGRPLEFARLAAHIVENPMINGETIRLDGAIRMGPR